jgi:hypothetical protein
MVKIGDIVTYQIGKANLRGIVTHINEFEAVQVYDHIKEGREAIKLGRVPPGFSLEKGEYTIE